MDKIELAAAPTWSRRETPFFARAAGALFDVRADAGAAAEIDLYDEIGMWGVTAKDFRERLKAAGTSDVLLRINSPGGDVFDGIAIYNDLLAHPGSVTVHVTGLAASAASIIAMVGRKIIMSENAFMMIHNAWGIAVGDRHTHADAAALLGKIDSALAKTYAQRTGTGVRAIAQMMDDETWLKATDAKEKGFADEIASADDKDAKASWDLGVFAHVPDELKALGLSIEPDEPIDPKTLRDVERVLMQDAGMTRQRARSFMSACRCVFGAKQDAGDGGAHNSNPGTTQDAGAESASLVRMLSAFALPPRP